MQQKTIFSNLNIDYEMIGLKPGVEESLHIGFGVDRKFIKPMGVSIYSIIKNNPQTRFVFHVLTEKIGGKDRRKLQQLALKSATTIYLYYCKTACFKGLPIASNLSHATYYRLLLPEIIKNLTPRVLYLDADIICLNRIDEIIKIDLNDKIAAAAMDFAYQGNLVRLKLTQKHYFNAGVLLIDVAKWNQYAVTSKALAILRNNPDCIHLEQDALNIVLNEKIKIIAAKWNQIYDIILTNQSISPETVFLHYTNHSKPWQADYRDSAREYFLEYQRSSPWAGERFKLPKLSRRRQKAYFKLLWREGQYFKAGLWYIRYHL